MATGEEIERRVEETDTPRTARRKAAAKKIGELAESRAVIAEQLADVERQLGDVLAEAEDVIEVDEFARITDVPAADLTRWLTAAHSARKAQAKRKRTQADGTSAPTPRKPGQVTTPPSVSPARRAVSDGTPVSVGAATD